MTTPTRILALLTTAALALGAAPAFASLGDEVAQGRALAGRLQAGTTSCSKLSDSDFEHLGEYVMDRMIGSRSAHQAMNSRMETMMGPETADRMHQALGRRFAGCAPGNAGPMMGGGGMMGGAGMMGGTAGGWGAMMSSGNWSWMHDAGWRHMTRAQWRNAANTMMGGWVTTGSGSGWSGGAIAAVVVLALLAGGLVAVVIVRRPRHPGRPTAAGTGPVD